MLEFLSAWSFEVLAVVIAFVVVGAVVIALAQGRRR
jgi:hypothetical protein